ncbi:hypothetical protein [Hyphomonas sp.]|uniref:hypothetical protein n=1 Tax=Hyphomonas sp. TaxID=87 RepID=UPI003918F5D2
MSLTRDDAIQAIFNAVDEFNPQLPANLRLPLSEDALIYGEGAPLDSLNLVNLIMLVEQHVMDLTGAELILASEAAMSRKRSPYRSIAALVDYVVEVAQETVSG